MKTLMATLVLFASLSANASSGQWFREHIRGVSKVLSLVEMENSPIYEGKVCNLNAEEGTGVVMLKSPKGEIYAVSMESFYSSLSEDNIPDTAVLTEVDGCGTKTVRF